jgi:Zinc carboxypeptidase
MPSGRLLLTSIASLCLLCPRAGGPALDAAGQAAALPTPERFLGFRVGTDNKLARWDRIVEYMQLVAASSPRVRVRELGRTTKNNSFVLVELSAPDTLGNLDRFRQLERQLYFQGGPPTDAGRDEIFRSGKAVVLVTCNVHSTEIGSSQMALELVHRLATEDSPLVRKILDNVILLLVPSLNPDGQILVTDWFYQNLGTPFEGSAMPWLYHPYVGHDNNRDMYMFTQRESQLMARLLWQEWFPAVWLDEHQMGSSGARIFVMPAADPINPNVHPLIYRWNGILGQAQAAALEEAGKDGIIYNSTYTNYWQGAMAWAGWWHNQVGLLTEVASARVAAPVEQRRAELGRTPPPADDTQGRRGGGVERGPLPPPRDVTPRTAYPRPWLGGRWTLRDIVDYELIATMGLLEAAADEREPLLRQIFEVNRATIETGQKGDPAAILIPVAQQHDPMSAIHLVEKLQLGGVGVYRAETSVEADGKTYPAGTFLVPMAQVFGRYAKDLLEKQTYPEVRRTPASPPEPPYDVTAWSLGMQMGVETVFVKKPLPAGASLTRVTDRPALPGSVSGRGTRFLFEYSGADTAIVVNRLLREAARVTFEPTRERNRAVTRVAVTGVGRQRMEALASEFGLSVSAGPLPNGGRGRLPAPIIVRAPRIGLYQPWTASMDEGWTRWVLEQFEFAPLTLHNADIKAGSLRNRFDVIVLADQQPRSILEGQTGESVRPEYRGGIGEEGIEALHSFVADGGTLITLGAACGLAIERWPIPVRDLKRGLTRDQHFAPGTIVRIEVDPSSQLGWGLPAETYGYYDNNPFFQITEGFLSQRVSVIVRYPNANIVASGWLKGEELMAGRAAVVEVDTNPGRIVLFGLRPQHRAQTHATFPLLFNALYAAAENSGQ